VFVVLVLDNESLNIVTFIWLIVFFSRNMPGTCCIKQETRNTDVRRSTPQNTH
jgi:hypothetical protein